LTFAAGILDLGIRGTWALIFTHERILNFAYCLEF